jgi:hypothetical protein
VEALKELRLFYIETKYQFLVSLSIVVNQGSDKRQYSDEYSTVFIDSTPDGYFYKNKQLIISSFQIDVQRVDSQSYYRNVLNSVSVAKKFRFDVNSTYFFFFSNRSPIANKLSSYYKKSQTTLVEEGLSLYRLDEPTSFRNRIKRLFKELAISAVTQCRYCDLFGETYYAGSLMLRYEELHQKDKIVKSKKTLKLPNLSTLLFVESPLQTLFDVPEFDFGGNRKSMIFFGQPLSELGMVLFEDEIKVIQKVKTVLNRFDIDLIIKAHPNDKKNKYNSLECIKMPEDIPAEVICFSNISLVGVFSFYSTAAINVGASLDLPIFFLFRLLGSLGFELNYPSNANIVSLTEIDGCLDEILSQI